MSPMLSDVNQRDSGPPFKVAMPPFINIAGNSAGLIPVFGKVRLDSYLLVGELGMLTIARHVCHHWLVIQASQLFI